MNKSVSLLGSPFKVEVFAFDICACCCSRLVVELCELLYVWFLDALFPQGRPYAAVLHCVESFLEIDGCDPQRLVPLGGSVGVAGTCKSGLSWSIEQMGRQFDGDDGPPLLFITLIGAEQHQQNEQQPSHCSLGRDKRDTSPERSKNMELCSDHKGKSRTEARGRSEHVRAIRPAVLVCNFTFM